MQSRNTFCICVHVCTARLCFWDEQFHVHWTMHVQSSLSILEKHVCVVHVRSSRARCRGQFIGVRIINNSIIVWLISIRIDAELKEVHGETRPRGDVCLVTPKGPSASTLESLEKALQTVGRICFLLCLLHLLRFILVPPSPFPRNRKGVSNRATVRDFLFL